MARECRIAHGELRVHGIRPQAEFPVHQNLFPAVAEIELAAEIRYEYERKFQSLAPMNGHDAHDILALPQRARRREIRIHRAHPFDEAQEPEQAAEIRLFVFRCTIDEHA